MAFYPAFKLQKGVSSMRKLVLIPLFVFFLAGVAQAAPILYFSTDENSAQTSWVVYETAAGSNLYEMSFDHIVVDTTTPMDPSVMGDEVVLPTMAISDIVSGTIFIGGTPIHTITALLTPIVDPNRGLDGKVYLLDDNPSGVARMEADLGGGGLLSVAYNYLAYSTPQNDLTNVGYGATGFVGYSSVIDGFVSAGSQGFAVDFSFSGDAASSLYALLNDLSGAPVSGTISGQISAVPLPAAVLLLASGIIGLAGLRRTCRKN